MLEQQPLLAQRIINCLSINYGIEVAKLTFLNLGADMHASVYKAQTYDHSSYFVKLKHNQYDENSATIITLLHNAGIQQIIPLIKTIRGQTVQCIDDFTLTVSPFIEGQDGFSHALTSDQWITFGQVLRQIHEFNVPPSIQAIVQRETYSPKWRKAIRSLYTCIQSKPQGDEITLKLVSFMKKHTMTIQRLIDRAEHLSQKIQDQSPKLVLCHSDIHGGNLLIENTGAIYIVDWDHPIMAPKERDLMFIGGGVANLWNKPNEVNLFYKGYGQTEVNMALLAYYRHERIIEDIVLYSQQLLSTQAGKQDRIQCYKEFIAQFEPEGVVQIAFKTDIDL